MSDALFDQIRALGARALADQYRKGALSPLEVAHAVLEAIERIDSVINAVPLPLAEPALAQARVSETRWRQGTSIGPFDGVPTLIKDGLPMRGLPVRRGSRAHAREAPAPTEDAPCVARLQEAGAVILGKTSMCDYGILPSGYSSQYGPTRNPWDPTRTSGGSSSGSAAVVAAGLVPFTVGTDIVGSIRQPASYCGLAGHKSSYGRVPYHPQNSPSLVAGPMAREVADAALLMTLLCKPDARDITSLPPDGTDYGAELSEADAAGLRIGVLPALGLGHAPSATVSTVLQASAACLQAQGAELVPRAVPFSPEDLDCAERFYQVRALSELELLPDDVQRQAEVLHTWCAPARAYGATAHYRDYLGLLALRRRTMELMDDIDYLLLPSAPIAPPPAELPASDPDRLFDDWAYTFLFNLSEQPAASINGGFDADGLPVGVQIVGRRYDDVGVLRLASVFERARPEAARPVWPIL